MSQDKCIIEVNGVEVEAIPGQMLIEVTDAAGAYVPRFCYHDKLSIAANCRMCLVEVEKAPKPMPACATPVTPGMKVSTKSTRAISAQKATMEFLLINHPLDCPICDQAGECELQDLAMGFGRGVSRFVERKRVVKDKDIGPLVSTDMTRCIHCTRCVRFTREIAGYQELGTIGRGDRVEISPYIERGVRHELSGNIIDLCPVGALNSKPFRFSARAWEMSQRTTISPHDCFGSRMYAHVMGGRIKRVVPQPCASLNETWLADRDRFSYEGLYAADRLDQPMIREDAGWRAAGWDEALEVAARGLRDAGEAGALVSPNTTTEEGYLLARLMDHLGSANIDYRLRRRDFRSQDSDPPVPMLGMPIEAIDELEQILVVGSNLRSEVPLLAHRIRKAAMRGAGVHFINPAQYSYLFPVAGYLQGEAPDFWLSLATLLGAAEPATSSRDAAAAALLARAPAAGEQHRALVERLKAAPRSAIFLGHMAQRHPEFAAIDWLAAELARATGSTLGYVTEGANAAGLALAGVLPHRERGGKARVRAGASAADMLRTPPAGLLLFGFEPHADCADGARAQAALAGARFTVACSAYLTDELRTLARVVLPIAAAAESAGTFVNGQGLWQSFEAAASPPGEARPGWKVLRVLGNRLGVPDFDYPSVQSVRDELRNAIAAVPAGAADIPRSAPGMAASAVSLADLEVGLYRTDPQVRRAGALQVVAQTELSDRAPTRRYG